MALKIQSTMVPEGDFPAVEAKDVLMPDGKRLSEENFAPEQPTEVDITDFSESGIITETFEDGSGNTYTFVYDEETDSTTITDSEGNLTVVKGLAIGEGASGKDGFSPIVDVSEIEGGHRVTVTDEDGTETFDVMDGGSPTISVTTDNTHIYVEVTNVDGTSEGTMIPIPEDGADGAPGLRWRGEWDADTVYFATSKDAVYYNGSSYVCTANTAAVSGIVPEGDTTGSWTLLAKKGEDGSGEEPLTGSTTEVTPTQVAEAVAEGRPIILTYTDSFYGNVVLSNFGRVDGLNLVTASTVVEVVDELFSATLTGDTGYNTWAYKFERIVRNAELDELETLPEVTAEDNGKFLGVVDGVWAAVTVSNAEDTSF